MLAMTTLLKLWFFFGQWFISIFSKTIMHFNPWFNYNNFICPTSKMRELFWHTHSKHSNLLIVFNNRDAKSNSTIISQRAASLSNNIEPEHIYEEYTLHKFTWNDCVDKIMFDIKLFRTRANLFFFLFFATQYLSLAHSTRTSFMAP